MKPPVLFLDVDGVLNTRGTLPGEGVRSVELNIPYGRRVTGVIVQDKLHATLGLVEECRARIVVSSSWRLYFDTAAAFASAIGISPMRDLGELFHRDWFTPMKFSASRAQEISLWLADHKAVKRYAILDDHDICAGRPSKIDAHFVRTDAAVGVTDADLRRVGALLGYPNMN